ncbi:MAG: hypothetical protein ABIO24_07615 [Saprospiraceae bacterium]
MLLLDLTTLLPIFLTILFGVISLIIGLSVKRLRNAQRRKAALQTAETHGLAFSENDNFGLAPQLKAFELFRHSRRRWRWNNSSRVSNVLRGQVGDTEVFQFDYSYVISTGKSARRVSQTVFFANDKQWSLPDFRLRPEQWWHKVLAILGVDNDIDFPENPDFSKKFHLSSSLEQIARTKFGPELQKFLLAGPRIHLEGNNYYLIAYHPRKLLKGEDSSLFYERCCQLTALLKGQEKQDFLDLTELKRPEIAAPIRLQNTSAKKD